MLKKLLSKSANNVLQLTNITCKDTSSIVSEMMDHQVSLKNYWRANIHLAMCGICRYYKTQLKTLTRLTRNLANKNLPTKVDITLRPKSATKFKNS